MKTNRKRHNRWEAYLPSNPVLFGFGSLFDFGGSYFEIMAYKIRKMSANQSIQEDWLSLQEDFLEVQNEHSDELSEKEQAHKSNKKRHASASKS